MSFVLVLIVVQILDRCADIQLLCRYSTNLQIFDRYSDMQPLCSYSTVVQIFHRYADMQPFWRCLTAVQICNRCADIPTLCRCSTVVEIFDLSTLIRNSPTTRNISLVFTFIKRNDDSFSFQRNSVGYQQNKPNRVHIERKRRFFIKGKKSFWEEIWLIPSTVLRSFSCC